MSLACACVVVLLFFSLVSAIACSGKAVSCVHFQSKEKQCGTTYAVSGDCNHGMSLRKFPDIFPDPERIRANKVHFEHGPYIQVTTRSFPDASTAEQEGLPEKVVGAFIFKPRV